MVTVQIQILILLVGPEILPPSLLSLFLPPFFSSSQHARCLCCSGLAVLPRLALDTSTPTAPKIGNASLLVGGSHVKHQGLEITLEMNFYCPALKYG